MCALHVHCTYIAYMLYKYIVHVHVQCTMYMCMYSVQCTCVQHVRCTLYMCMYCVQAVHVHCTTYMYIVHDVFDTVTVTAYKTCRAADRVRVHAARLMVLTLFNPHVLACLPQ